MKIYLAKTNGNNFVVFTDGETGQVFDGAPLECIMVLIFMQRMQT